MLRKTLCIKLKPAEEKTEEYRKCQLFSMKQILEAGVISVTRQEDGILKCLNLSSQKETESTLLIFRKPVKTNRASL
jgi:hypothetical protein